MEAHAESEAAAALRKPARRPAFELKGVMTSLAVLRLCTGDLTLIERQLRIKIAQLPQFFQAVPVVLDFGAMPKGGSEVRLGTLVALLRACHLIPVGITNAADDVTRIAVAVGLGVMPLRAGRTPTPAARTADVGGPAIRGDAPRAGDAVNGTAVRAEAGNSAATGRDRAAGSARAGSANGARDGVARTSTAPEPAAHRLPLVVRQPVRGGQIIYAQGTDLVILAPVNSGAEVIADGHVHIYATLRGRAVAGAQGMIDARIFCQRLEAELVAVAGAYLMADDIPPDRRGLPSQVYLDAGECRVAAL